MRGRSAATFLAVVGAATLLTTAVVSGAVAAGAATPPDRTVWTFESDPVGAVPPGCTTPAGALPVTVSDARGYRSAKSLLLDDQSTSAIAEISCPSAARTGAELDFQLYPQELANGLQFTLLGDLADYPGGPRAVFHLGVTATGSIRWYDGAGWTQIAPAGAVPVRSWSAVRLVVPADQGEAYVYVDGRYVGQSGPWGVRAVTDITGFQFSSAGTATAGDEAYLDDIAYGAPGPHPTGPQPFRVSAPTTIAQSATPIQMPNTAVSVRVNGRPQILMDYPAHTDVSATSGNVLVVSTDGGRSWTEAQDRNPLPDAPSFDLSRLPNGDLLAVDYHTYMTPDSGDLQADVPEAVSHDGGMTWTLFTGEQTTPQPMRVISATTDWPGHPLGGFVLVHSVVADPDGTLYQSGYGYYAADGGTYRQVLLVSTDEGHTWSTRTVAVNPTLSSDPGYQGFCEGAIERVADGSLLIVMRTGSYQPMYTARSTDDGQTWSTPQPLLAGRDQQPVVGIYPSLTLMGNGQLVLWVGRPGQAMLTSPDGSGRSWTAPQEIDYANSGNGVTLAVNSRQLLAFGDRGANWSFPTPAPYGVWVRTVTVAGPGRWWHS